MNECKQRIENLKAGIEKSRLQKALPRLGKLSMGGDFSISGPDPEEEAAKAQIDEVSSDAIFVLGVIMTALE